MQSSLDVLENEGNVPASVDDSGSSLSGRGYGRVVSGAAASPVPVFYPDNLPAAAAAPGGEYPAAEHSFNAELRFAARNAAPPALRHGTVHHPAVPPGQPEPALHGNRHQLGKREEFSFGKPGAHSAVWEIGPCHKESFRQSLKQT